jgi:hypothetical protein
MYGDMSAFCVNVNMQVATIATYGFFVFALFARQFLDPEKMQNFGALGYYHEVDFYFPFFTVLQFLFFVGWIKVGLQWRRR